MIKTIVFKISLSIILLAVLLCLALLVFVWLQVNHDEYKYNTASAMYNYITHDGKVIIHMPQDAVGTISVRCSNPESITKIIARHHKVVFFVGYGWFDFEIEYVSSNHKINKLIISTQHLNNWDVNEFLPVMVNGKLEYNAIINGRNLTRECDHVRCVWGIQINNDKVNLRKPLGCGNALINSNQQ